MGQECTAEIDNCLLCTHNLMKAYMYMYIGWKTVMCAWQYLDFWTEFESSVNIKQEYNAVQTTMIGMVLKNLSYPYMIPKIHFLHLKVSVHCLMSFLYMNLFIVPNTNSSLVIRKYLNNTKYASCCQVALESITMTPELQKLWEHHFIRDNIIVLRPLAKGMTIWAANWPWVWWWWAIWLITDKESFPLQLDDVTFL